MPAGNRLPSHAKAIIRRAGSAERRFAATSHPTRGTSVRRTVIAAFLSSGLTAAAMADPPVIPPPVIPPTSSPFSAAEPQADEGAATAETTVNEVLAAVMRQASGVPARVALGERASLRLSEELYFLPVQSARKLMLMTGGQIPPDTLGLLLGPEGLEMAGPVRFIPAGFIDPGTIQAWTDEDILASLRDSVLQGNVERVRNGQTPLEARAWIQPPQYDPQTHHLAWAALIVAQNAPKNSDGEVLYNAIAFGREGYIQLSMAAGVQKAETLKRLTAAFLGGLTFAPGQGYPEAAPKDAQPANGLAKAMGMDSLHKAPIFRNFWGSDVIIPVSGSVIAAIAVLTLVVFRIRYTRKEARRG
jgi:uncharacterized membrane-anchored protein